MDPKNITLVLGVDREHLSELRWTWPTWMRFKPELREMPLVVFYDPVQVDISEASFLSEHPEVRFVAWNWNLGIDQREKMITGWVHVPAQEVRTPWYLKLDTDVLATGDGAWIKDEWFVAGSSGELPVFVSSEWGYSKPRYVMDLLDDWGDKVPQIARFPRLNLPYSSNDGIQRHPRIISWLYFGRTEWNREVVGYLGPDGRLPFASQDTLFFYCAKRMGQCFVRTRMNEYQWAHKRIGFIRKFVRVHGMQPCS